MRAIIIINMAKVALISLLKTFFSRIFTSGIVYATCNVAREHDFIRTARIQE